MEALQALVADAGPIVAGNWRWMAWNTLLAAVPALLAVVVFRRAGEGRWGPLRWAGLVVFVLFLPNAPYVVTDLVHLRGDVGQAETDLAVYAGVLPMYVAFIAAGFFCYAVALAEVRHWLQRTGRRHLAGPVEIGLHLLCAVGVLLGRVARLNSWDTFTSPDGTVERALETLTWRGSPATLLVLFLVIWLGHAVTHALTVYAREWVQRRLPRRLGSAAS